MVSHIGAVLRLLGPLIQLLNIRLLLKYKEGDTLLGLPMAQALWIGFFLGFALSLLGIFLSRKGRKSKPMYRIDRDLHLG